MAARQYPSTFGSFAGGKHQLQLRIYYEDTDAGGVVYHANYLRFFERGRTEMFETMGIGNIATATDGVIYVVVNANIRYFRPARLGEIVTIESQAEDFRGARCVVKHRVIRDGDLLAEGRILLALIGKDWRPKAQPAHWLKAFEAAMGVEPPE